MLGGILRECRAAADRHRAALIFDEIQCGLGRTGAMFAFQSFGVTPDIVAIAKPHCGGAAVGAFIAKEDLLRRFHRDSMELLLVGGRWRAAWRWSFWRLWKMKSFWTM